MMTKRSYAVILVCAASLIAPLGAVFGQQEDNESRTIVSMHVKNNKAISEETILSKLKSQPGQPFSQQTVNEDLKRLYATDFFLDVSIDAARVQEGVEVTIIMEKKPKNHHHHF